MSKRKVKKNQGSTNSSKNTQKIKKVPVKQSQVTKNFKNSYLFDKSKIQKLPYRWPSLDIRGPRPDSNLLGVKIIKNRPLIGVFREITEQIHKNMLKFRRTAMLKFQERKDVPKLDEIMDIVEKMCCETMKVDNITFDFSGILEAIRKCFGPKKKQVVPRYSPEFLEQLRRIFAKRGVAIGRENLCRIRRRLMLFFFHISLDFVNFIFSLKVVKRKKCIRIEGFYPMDIFTDQFLLSDTIYQNLASVASVQNLFRDDVIARTTPCVSLWTSIPCEHDDNEYLLKHVFEWGLIRLLPEDVKSFLTTWMIKVRKRMRKRLTREDLHRVIGAALQMNIDQEKLETNINHSAIRQFLEKINENVLNCLDNFEIFGEKWAESVMDFVQEPRHGPVSDEQVQKFVDASRIETKATAYLSSMFLNSSSDQCLLTHTLVQLYSFLIYFSYATIRHVFSSTSSDQIVFEWSLEEDVIDYTKIDEFAKQGKKEETKESTSIGTEIGRPADSLNVNNNWLDGFAIFY